MVDVSYRFDRNEFASFLILYFFKITLIDMKSKIQKARSEKQFNSIYCQISNNYPNVFTNFACDSF